MKIEYKYLRSTCFASSVLHCQSILLNKSSNAAYFVLSRMVTAKVEYLISVCFLAVGLRLCFAVIVENYS